MLRSSPAWKSSSSKTAIISSVYFPQLIWLAVGGLYSLNLEKFRILTCRKVILFPDSDGFDKWNKKVKELSHLAIISISSLMEQIATKLEREQGLDLVDYLIRFDYKEFFNDSPNGSRPPDYT